MAISPTEMQDWTIYKITNPKGRVYVGKSCDYKRRVYHYRIFGGKGQPLVQRSMNKYGFENHQFHVLDTFRNTGIYCDDKEMFWIRSYMSNRNKYPEQNGMNLTNGGDGSLGAKKSDAERQKMRERNLGKTNSAHQRETASRIHKGNKWSLGRKQPPEEVEGRAAQLRGRKYTDEQKGKYAAAIKRRSRPIIQIDNNGGYIKEFPAIASAERELSVNNIYKVLVGKMNHTKGLIFKYKQP